MSGLFGGSEKTTVTPNASIQLSPLYGFQGGSSTGASLSAVPGSGAFNTAFSPLSMRGVEVGEAGNTSGRGRVFDMIGKLKSNQNPFIQARVNPIRDEMARRRADLSRSIAQRGVMGSLGNNELLKFDSQADRELADQTALATNEALTSLMSAEGLIKGLNEGQVEIANEYLRRDLSALGLDLNAVQIALSGRQFSDGGSTTKTSGGGDFGSTLLGIGSILTGIGSF